ncbi:MAG: hypothetical protein RMJ44_02955 [Cytophagales bacterium]|nr:hypothetical protein [Bernardetiaceae bacterium]MDW8210022.1 hypothetical protein [Cytophagales bacterium]
MLLQKIRRYFIGGKANPQEQRTAFASWEIIQNRKCLVLTFNGIFTEAEAEKFTQQLSQEMQSCKEDEKVPIVCRCYHMVDYEAHARIIFQNFLQTYLDKIDSLWIITESVVIRYGGKLIGMFVEIPVRVVNEESKVLLY